MARYITEKDQVEMLKIMDEYATLYELGAHKTPKAERLIGKLFTEYVDKIIEGVIRKKQYNKESLDRGELYDIARLHIWKSVYKRQFNPARATLFTFFTTVIMNNLKNAVATSRKKSARTHDYIDIDSPEGSPQHLVLATPEPEELPVEIEDALKLILDHFKNRDHRMKSLSEVYCAYVKNFLGERIIKKRFIEYAMTHPMAFSSSYVARFLAEVNELGRPFGISSRKDKSND